MKKKTDKHIGPDACPRCKAKEGLHTIECFRIVETDLDKRITAYLDGKIPKIEDVELLLQKVDAATKALERIKGAMGGDDPSGGWNFPEEVWGIANEALKTLSPKA